VETCREALRFAQRNQVCKGMGSQDMRSARWGGGGGAEGGMRKGRAGQSRAGQDRAGQDRAGQGRAWHGRAGLGTFSSRGAPDSDVAVPIVFGSISPLDRLHAVQPFCFSATV
jgi:hypothetical protein